MQEGSPVMAIKEGKKRGGSIRSAKLQVSKRASASNDQLTSRTAPIGWSDAKASGNRQQDVKTVTFVFGPGRSGTSLCTEILIRSGVYAGDQLLSGDRLNPRGYFEDKRLLEINKKLMADYGVEIFMTMPWRWNVTQTYAAYIEKAEGLLKDYSTKADLIVFKDPRLALLLPLWQDAATRCGLSTRNVLCVRDIGDVLASGIDLRDDRWIGPRIELMVFYRILESMLSCRANAYILHYRQWWRDRVNVYNSLADYIGIPDENRLSSVELRDIIKDELDRSSLDPVPPTFPPLRKLTRLLQDVHGIPDARDDFVEACRNLQRQSSHISAVFQILGRRNQDLRALRLERDELRAAINRERADTSAAQKELETSPELAQRLPTALNLTEQEFQTERSSVERQKKQQELEDLRITAALLRFENEQWRRRLGAVTERLQGELEEKERELDEVRRASQGLQGARRV
jgi:hypothetical protein